MHSWWYLSDILFGSCLFLAHRDAILCRKLLLVNGVEYFTRFLIVESLKNRIEFVLVLAIVIVILWDVVMSWHEYHAIIGLHTRLAAILKHLAALTGSFASSGHPRFPASYASPWIYHAKHLTRKIITLDDIVNIFKPEPWTSVKLLTLLAVCLMSGRGSSFC